MANEYRASWSGLEVYHVTVSSVRATWSGVEVFHKTVSAVRVSWSGLEVFHSLPPEPTIGGRRPRSRDEDEETAPRRRPRQVPEVAAAEVLRRRPAIRFEDLAETEPFARRRAFGLAPSPSRVRPWFQIFTS